MRASIIAAAVMLALVQTASARADSVAYNGAALAYTGDAGPDQVVVARDGAALVFRAGARQSLAAAPPCAHRGPSEVACPADAITAVTVDLLGGNDTLAATLPDTPPTSLTAHGNGGNDVLDASSTTSGALFGDEGNDRLLAGRQSFDVDGGTGADELAGGAAGAQTRFLMGAGPDGGDRVLGGRGIDLVSYAGRTAPVRLTEDGAADDGEAGEGDLIAHAVEILQGGAAGDTLAGGPGPNTLLAGPGDDAVLARDAVVDQVDCGATAELDVVDTAVDCEVAQRSALDVAVTGLERSVSWGRLRRGLRFAVAASAPARWTFVLLGVRAGSRALTRRSLPLGAGPRTVTLKPRRPRLGRHRHLTLRVRITAVAADGARMVVIRRVRIRSE